MGPGFRRGDTGVGAAAGARFMPSWVDAVGGNSVVQGLSSGRALRGPGGRILRSQLVHLQSGRLRLAPMGESWDDNQMVRPGISLDRDVL